MSGMATTTTELINGSPNIARVKAAATTNPNSVKVGPGNVYGFFFCGQSAAALSRFVKFYDKASAPVVGTDIPVFTVPVISTTTLPGLAELSLDYGIPFKLGIAYAITGAIGDADATAVGADDIHGFILWK